MIPEKDFWNTFNLGVGFCLIIDKKFKNEIYKISHENDIECWEIGKICKKDNSKKKQFLSEIIIQIFIRKFLKKSKI